MKQLECATTSDDIHVLKKTSLLPDAKANRAQQFYNLYK